MLRGGGGSTIGVVTSLTVKALPKLETTTVTFNFTVNDDIKRLCCWFKKNVVHDLDLEPSSLFLRANITE